MKSMIINKIREILLTFCMITTGIIFATFAYIKIFYGSEEVEVNILWQIPVTAFLCSMGNLIHPMHEVGKRRFWLNMVLHYLYINVVVLGAGSYFEWFDYGVLIMVLGMMALIMIIFVVISFVMWKLSIRESRQLNEKLLEYQRKKLHQEKLAEADQHRHREA